MRVLLVEDEPHLGQAVEAQIASAGHTVHWVPRTDEAEVALGALDFGLILLDLQLAEGSGIELLQRLRRRGNQRPVIILTSRDQTTDKIHGLNAGADDYLVKPIDLDELEARVAAVARRYAGNRHPLFCRGAVEVDMATRNVRLAGKQVDLTRREWAMLDQFLERPEDVVTKSMMRAALHALGIEVESNAVEVYISRLRKKLGRDFIRTVRGIGYRLED